MPAPPNAPVVQGGSASGFGVVPALPSGLHLDRDTGVISGTPDALTETREYVIGAKVDGVPVEARVRISVTGPLVLLDDATPAAPVHWYGGTEEAAAAATLASYLNRVSGRPAFQATQGPTAKPARALIVGMPPYAGFGLPADLREDDFVVRMVGECLHLAGAHPRSTHWAVSTFLERYLDCRFFAMEPPAFQTLEEDVPGRYPLALLWPNLVVRPAMEFRDGGSGESRDATYARRRLTWSRDFGQVTYIGGPHNLHFLVEDPAHGGYALSHPEVYPAASAGPADTVLRERNVIHLCYTHPGLAQAIADALAVEVEANGRDVKHNIYWCGTGDWWGGLCQCDRCTPIYEAETWTEDDGDRWPGYSAPLIRMMNQVAAILDARYPGIRVGTFAYFSTTAPPGITRPAKNLLIRIPHARRCIVHPAGQCGEFGNGSFLRMVKGWGEKDQGGGVHIWDYGQNFTSGFWLPLPTLYSIAQNIKEYAAVGVDGMYIQGVTVSTGGDLVVAKNWVWSHLMVNPSLDIDDLLEDFCDRYYGAGAPHILSYIRRMRDSVYDSQGEPIHHCNEFIEMAAQRQSFLTPAVIEGARADRASALAAVAGDETLTRRVMEATVGVLASELYVYDSGNQDAVGYTGPLAEGTHDGKDVLIRQSIGRYVYDEAVDMLRYIRNSSPNEYGNGIKLRAQQLRFQGGPLVKLSNNGLLVKVAPAIIGQIRQITYQGDDLLAVGTVGGEFDATYPFNMSSHAFTDPSVQHYTVQGQPSSTSVVLTGEAGMKTWGNGKTPVDQIHRQHIDVGGTSSEPSLKVRVTAELRPDGDPDTALCVTQTVYRVTADPSDHSVTTDLASGVVTIRLPGRSWTIRDAYVGSNVSQMTATHDPAKQTLTVSVTAADTAVLGTERTVVTRTLTIVPD
jgi:hypothetical protein